MMSANKLINQYIETKDFEDFKLEILKNMAIESPFTADELFSKRVNEIIGQAITKLHINITGKINTNFCTGLPGD